MSACHGAVSSLLTDSFCSVDQCPSSVSVIFQWHQTDCDDFYFHSFTACFAGLSQSTDPRGTVEYDLHNTNTLLGLCCCVSLPSCCYFWRKGKREASGEKVGHLTNFQKNIGSVCFFVFLCIKHLNFSSSTVSLLFPRQGMHGVRKAIHTGTNCFLTASQISTQPISYLSSLLPVIRPSAHEDKFQHFIR